MGDTMFVGTEVFLSFLVRDNEKRFQAAKALFERAEGGRARLETNEMVLGELARVLEQKYRMPSRNVAEVLEAVLGTRNLRLPSRRVVKRAVESYGAENLSFAEAYNRAYAVERGLKPADALETGKQKREKEAAV